MEGQMIASFALRAPEFVSNSFLGQRIPSVMSPKHDHRVSPWSRRAHELPLSATQMIEALKALGMPISAIAETVRVERKTVYAWLNGVAARSEKMTRIETLYRLLSAEEPGSLKWFYQYWDRTLADGLTLREALRSEQIDPERVRTALEALRPAVSRAMEAERKRAPAHREEGPPGLLNLYLDASARR
jgi:hypothetical protein